MLKVHGSKNNLDFYTWLFPAYGYRVFAEQVSLAELAFGSC
jgi:hypothetical protein